MCVCFHEMKEKKERKEGKRKERKEKGVGWESPRLSSRHYTVSPFCTSLNIIVNVNILYLYDSLPSLYILVIINEIYIFVTNFHKLAFL